jgi:hypothetical protein
MSEKPHFENLAELAQEPKELSPGEQYSEAKVEAAPAVEQPPEHQVESLHEAVKEAFEDVADLSEQVRTTVEEASAEPTAAAAPPSKYAKSLTAKRELGNVRKRLSTQERALSQIANRASAAQDVVAKSVTRPSGLLGGGIVAFLGSTSYLILAKHLGFEYNSFVFAFLFVVGFVVGLSMEAIARSLNRASRS